MIGWLAQILSGGLVGEITRTITTLQQQRLSAENSAQRLELDRQIAGLMNQRTIAQIEAQRFWSATSLGRWLIVVPFGLWWASIMFVSIANPFFGWTLTVDALPPNIMQMANVLVPGIILADAGSILTRRYLAR